MYTVKLNFIHISKGHLKENNEFYHEFNVDTWFNMI